jgi:molybdopterin adenylyltransferase
VNDFVPLSIAVVTISDSRGAADDRSGDTLCAAIAAAGHTLLERAWVRDDVYAIRAVTSRWIADAAVQVILTTGGSGVTGRDVTPEAIRPLLDREMPGFGELFRARSFAEIGPAALTSRALAGTANGTLLFLLPGSPGACRTAWGVLEPQLDARTRPCNLTELLPRLREGGGG